MASKFVAPRFAKVARRGRENSRVKLTDDTTLVLPNAIVARLESEPGFNTGRQVKKLISGYSPIPSK